MTEPRRLRAIPDGRDATILDWLGAAEPVDARPVLEAAFARLPGVRQVRPWPWDSIVDVLRPIDRRTRQTRWAILLVAVALLMALLIGTLLPGGYLNVPRPSVLPAPTAPLAVAPSVLVGPSASARAIHPLAVPRLAIASAGKDGRLYVDWSDGTTRVRLGQDITAGLAQPAWSPDGKRILVLAGAADTEQQWEVDPRGADPSQVVLPCTSPCGSRNEASYSRDGTRIVFFEARGDVVAGIPSRCSLMIYDRRSQEVDAVHAFDCGVEEDREPRFSPDGEKVAFWRSRHDLQVRRWPSTRRRSSFATCEPARSSRSLTGRSTPPRSTGRPTVDGSRSRKTGGRTRAATSQTSGGSIRMGPACSRSPIFARAGPGSRATAPTDGGSCSLGSFRRVRGSRRSRRTAASRSRCCLVASRSTSSMCCRPRASMERLGGACRRRRRRSRATATAAVAVGLISRG